MRIDRLRRGDDALSSGAEGAMKLVSCSVCRRHVRACEERCPFCGGAVPLRDLAPTVDATGLGRARRYALGAAIAVGTAGSASLGATACQGSGAAQPKGHVVVIERVDASAGPVGVTDPDPFPSETHNAPPPPPPPTTTATARDPEEWDPRRRRRGSPCVKGPTGKLICPPYGCVFPDDSCEIVST